MSFKQKLFFDKSLLKEKIETILKARVEEIDLEYQEKGSTGAVNKVNITSNGVKSEFLLKQIDDLSYFNLYKDILEPQDLSHPKILGEIQIEKDTFLLMEWVKLVKKEWEKSDYIKAVEWLANKDTKLKPLIGTIENYSYIQKRNNYLENLKTERQDIFNKAQNSYANFFEIIDSKKLNSISNKLAETLSKEPITLCHNDFCRNNILITETEQIYVIDWTGPFIASAGIDLSVLLNDTPIEMQNEILNHYTESTNNDSIKDLIKDIQLDSMIGHVTWRFKRLLRNDDSYDDVREEISDIMYNIAKKT